VLPAADEHNVSAKAKSIHRNSMQGACSTLLVSSTDLVLWPEVGRYSQKVYDEVMNAEIEPALVTDPSLMGVLDELVSREPIFHRPELGTTRTDFENMITEDFWEVGASGRRYSRDFVLAELEKRYEVQAIDE
jgi:hypothetical protein